MSPSAQELEARKLFNEEQFAQFDNAINVITGPFTDAITHSTIRKIYYAAIVASYHAGRCAGVKETTELVTKMREAPEATRERPVG
jgi:hypothetical protein